MSCLWPAIIRSLDSVVLSAKQMSFVIQGNIEKLSVKQLEAYKADMWLLAPPCQPYTRRGLQKDADDWRASSFMTLLLKLPQMQVPPMRLLVENVVGFEGSRTRARMVEVMQAAGYAVQEFLISPVQLGIPYSRPRYFALMQRTPGKGGSPFPLQARPFFLPTLLEWCRPADPIGSPFTQPPSLLMQQQPASEGSAAVPSTAVTVQPVHNFLEDRHALYGQAVCETAHNTARPLHHDRAKTGKHIPNPDPIAGAAAPGASSDMTPIEEEEAFSCGQHSSSAPPHRAGAEPSASPDHTVKDEEDLTRKLFINRNTVGLSTDHTADDEEEEEGNTGTSDRGLPTNDCFISSDHVPADVVVKWGHVLDIVTPHSTVTNCFTKTYSRFAKGCGSVLATQNLESINFAYSTQQRSSSSQHFIKPRLIARPAHPLLPKTPKFETPQQSWHEREQGVQSGRGLQHSESYPDEHPCGQQSKAVDGHNSGQPNGQPNRHLDEQPNGLLSQHDGSPAATKQAGLHSNISQTRSNTNSGLVCSDREEASVQRAYRMADHTEPLPLDRAPNRSLTLHHMSSSCPEPLGQSCNEEDALLHWLQQLHLRYFSPREVANLHSFPSNFSFPPDVTIKQQYALLGNSLSVAVVADLLTYLLTP
ncbi:MAG: tRNA (cytosine(38)-C(5))-methyltransferase-like [Trebouxia sp. A1-2]|nr:MAG: tRNA (cytosine(38)-C(5))-methyltransferase-like [Trebouxia sp. A1-2]